MKRLKFLLIALVFSSIVIYTQQPSNFPKPQQVDEFGEILLTDIKARLDGLAVSLQNDPNSRMLIIAYRSAKIPVGKITRNFYFMKQYLTRNRGIDPSRLQFIDGGEAKSELTFQIWIVPAGAFPPELLKPVSNSLENSKIARKFDELYYAYKDLDYEYWDGDSFDEFSELLKKETDSIAYVILYPQYEKYGNEDDNEKPVIRKDSSKTTNSVIANIRKNLRKVGISLSKIKIVNGGYRDFRQIELWILPKGVEPPAATPNAFPKIQRKSGKR